MDMKVIIETEVSLFDDLEESSEPAKVGLIHLMIREGVFFNSDHVKIKDVKIVEAT